MIDSSRGVRVCHGETWEQAAGMEAGAESWGLILNCKHEAESELEMYVFNSGSPPHAPCLSSNKATPPEPLQSHHQLGAVGSNAHDGEHVIQQRLLVSWHCISTAGLHLSAALVTHTRWHSGTWWTKLGLLSSYLSEDKNVSGWPFKIKHSLSSLCLFLDNHPEGRKYRPWSLLETSFLQSIADNGAHLDKPQNVISTLRPSFPHWTPSLSSVHPPGESNLLYPPTATPGQCVPSYAKLQSQGHLVQICGPLFIFSSDFSGSERVCCCLRSLKALLPLWVGMNTTHIHTCLCHTNTPTYTYGKRLVLSSIS